jgi:DNA-binding GntR family transcriptional regulator
MYILFKLEVNVEGKIPAIEDLKFNVPDPKSQIPLYYQIYSDLLRLINSKQLSPDDTIPPELELTKIYGVSRQTLRGALKLLERERLIKRTAGKGTKVLASQNRIQFILNQSFAMQMRKLGLTPGSKVLKTGIPTKFLNPR